MYHKHWMILRILFYQLNEISCGEYNLICLGIKLIKKLNKIHIFRIHMGGSYPGGLSAWFRYKYPHLTVGGLASSGVVNPILDFGMFD